MVTGLEVPSRGRSGPQKSQPQPSLKSTPHVLGNSYWHVVIDNVATTWDFSQVLGKLRPTL